MSFDYSRFHQHPSNLVIHIVTVPLFASGLAASAYLLITGRVFIGGLLFLVPVACLALQGKGHRLEPEPPLPFTGPGNFVGRILKEQYYHFWVFVLTGGWYRALSASRTRELHRRP